MKNSTAKKRYQDMTIEQLREANRGYDAEMIDPPSKVAPPALAARHAKALKRAKAEAKRRGRPKIGQGATSILVSIERGLLGEADKFARNHHLSRSELMSMGIRMLMAKKSARPSRKSA